MDLYCYRCSVLSVHDGDTLHVDVDLGFHCHLRTKLRLAECYCPELRQPGGREARAFTLAAVTLGSGVVKIRGPDKYGDRWDGWLTVDGETTTLNEQLVAAGHATRTPPLGYCEDEDDD